MQLVLHAPRRLSVQAGPSRGACAWGQSRLRPPWPNRTGIIRRCGRSPEAPWALTECVCGFVRSGKPWVRAARRYYLYLGTTRRSLPARRRLGGSLHPKTTLIRNPTLQTRD